ncbi:MAG: hypothetical protein WKF94_12005 [Solirubrobacteraceae bacterium]
MLGIEPYFDEPFYVGYNVGGFELGLNPALEHGPITYWGVPDADAAVAELIAAGAQPGDPVTEVGEGIRVATVLDAAGSTVGVIENPHFETPDAPTSPGPGR